MVADNQDIPRMPDPMTFTRSLVGAVRRPLGRFRRAVRRRLSTPADPLRVEGYDRHLVAPPKGRALVLYLVRAFADEDDERRNCRRSEWVMSLEIAEAFNSLGYVVDVVDWQDARFEPSRHYDVLFGMGPHYERLCAALPETTKKIYFGTGAHWRYEDEREHARATYLRDRKGVWIEPRGMAPNRCAEISDGVVAFAGNDHILATWRPAAKKLFAVNNCAVPAHPLPDLASKDFSAARRNFLWLGSVHQVLRGLDLVLDAFQGMPDCCLWICAPLHDPRDRRFMRIYRSELFRSPNVHAVGWIDLRSKYLPMLAEKCAFGVYATCTDGMSGAVLAFMRTGAIPIVTRSAGVDVSECGLWIDDETVEGVRSRLTAASQLPEQDCQRLADNAVRLASTVYTLEGFASQMRLALTSLLDE